MSRFEREMERAKYRVEHPKLYILKSVVIALSIIIVVIAIGLGIIYGLIQFIKFSIGA